MSSNYFFIECGNEYGLPQNKIWLAYAPLNGASFLVTETEKISLQEECSSGKNTEKLSIGARALLRAPTRPIMRIPKSWDDVYEIDILLNFKCNFHCVYCYSAAGRSDTELQWQTVKPLLDYLFSDKHPARQPYRINFSGGGEPLLSFPLIRQITLAIEEKAIQSGHKFQLAMVTNGSLLTQEIIDFVSEHKIRLVVSFEILEKFQNLERGQYDKVARNIDLLLDNHANFGIRATLTAESAAAMPQMVQELHERFPRLKAVTFDTVLSADLFQTPDELKNYHEIFFANLQAAKEMGKKYGIKIGDPYYLLLSFQRERTCLGKLVLTPEGKFSTCSRISAPQEKLFNNFIYGEIDPGGEIQLNQEKFSKIMSENTISQPDCCNCFARWNCGGGCRLFALSFVKKEFLTVFCDFQKMALKRMLLDKIENDFYAKNGKTLQETIKNMIFE